MHDSQNKNTEPISKLVDAILSMKWSSRQLPFCQRHWAQRWEWEGGRTWWLEYFRGRNFECPLWAFCPRYSSWIPFSSPLSHNPNSSTLNPQNPNYTLNPLPPFTQFSHALPNINNIINTASVEYLITCFQFWVDVCFPFPARRTSEIVLRRDERHHAHIPYIHTCMHIQYAP